MQYYLVIGLLVLAACTGRKEPQYITLTGPTMGTTFTITYYDSLDRTFDREVDSILTEVNNSLSTYIPNSIISLFNSYDSTEFFRIDPHFYRVFLNGKHIWRLSEGAFNPAVMPLVRYYGFGPDSKPDYVDSTVVDSLRQLTDFGMVQGSVVVVPNPATGGMDTTWYLRKSDPRIQLDFSASAKGYGVDVLAEFLLDKGIARFYVEIGGELRTHGEYKDGKVWVIGIEDPATTSVQDRKFLAKIGMRNHALATSGNYRNIREIDGKQYVHTLDPATGYPAQGSILSASIVAPDCMTADAWATACMVLGHQKPWSLLPRPGWRLY
jgi:FAD:protein FMN transferase